MLSWGHPKPKDKRLDVLLFAFAAGTICMCYDRKRESFRSNYFNVSISSATAATLDTKFDRSLVRDFIPTALVVDLDACSSSIHTNDASFADNKKSAVKSRLSEGKGLAN